MSTKTTFKRIALAAVAALGLGVLSVAPSSAVVSNLTVTVADGTSTLYSGTTGGTSDTTTAATIAVSALFDHSTDTVVVTTVVKSAPAGASRVTLIGYLDTNTGTTTQVDDAAVFSGAISKYDSESISTAAYSFNSSSPAAYAGATFFVQLESGTGTTKAGTYGYTAVVKQYNNGVLASTTTKDFNITVAALASASTTPAASKQWAVMSASAQPNADAVDDVITSVSTVGTVAGYFTVGNRNASDAENSEDSVTATISGPGVLCYGSTCGKSFLIAATGDADFTIKADGNAGVATISSKTNTATFANKTVTFYAKAAKTITATVATPVLQIGANASAVSVSAVDANGTPWTGTAYIVASAAADALVGGSATTPVQCAAYNADDGILCPITAISAGTAKFKVIDASTVALATATSNEVTVKVSSNKPASVKLSFDKATYAPFEKATITVTPLDASGAGVPVQTLVALLATGGITSDYAFSAGSDTLTASTFSTSALTGVKKYTVYMPAASGSVTITATGGTALPAAGQVAVTATATIANASVDAATDAANEATDAANAATDAALAAADAADAATAAAQDASDAVAALSAEVSKMIASLKAQITSLTNLVIKIQKKVRA